MAEQRSLEAGQPDGELIQAGYRFALSLTHHHHDAEDLTQQAWVKVHQRYGLEKTKPLLFTTIRNLFLDQRRRDKIVPFESTETVRESVVEAAETTTPVAGDLEALLGQLGAAEREMLFLNCVEGYTAAEIARMFGLSRNTVLSRLARAKTKLRKLADEEENVSERRKTRWTTA